MITLCTGLIATHLTKSIFWESAIINRKEIGRLRIDFNNFRVEANNVNVIAEMRLISDQNTLALLHDRYIISQNIAFNVLPTKSLFRGQQGSLTLEEFHLIL